MDAVIQSLPGANPGGPNPYVKDGSIKTFMQDVVQPSMQTPVLVDFWATWCGPCKQLTPVLEKLTAAYKGKIRLVKIDIDQNKALAAQLGIQSVPAVFAFVGGQPVDAFMGALPEAELKQFIDRLLKGEQKADLQAALQQAKTELQAGNVAGAAMLYQEILTLDPQLPAALAGLGMCYLQSNDRARAETMAAQISENHRLHPEVAPFFAALELAAQAPDSEGLRAAESRMAQAPNDQAARLDYAKALSGAKRFEEAIEVLLHSIKLDRRYDDEAARKQIVKILEVLGFDHPLAASTRRKLSSVLFS